MEEGARGDVEGNVQMLKGTVGNLGWPPLLPSRLLTPSTSHPPSLPHRPRAFTPTPFRPTLSVPPHFLAQSVPSSFLLLLPPAHPQAILSALPLAVPSSTSSHTSCNTIGAAPLAASTSGGRRRDLLQGCQAYSDVVAYITLQVCVIEDEAGSVGCAGLCRSGRGGAGRGGAGYNNACITFQVSVIKDKARHAGCVEWRRVGR